MKQSPTLRVYLFWSSCIYVYIHVAGNWNRFEYMILKTFRKTSHESLKFRQVLKILTTWQISNTGYLQSFYYIPSSILCTSYDVYFFMNIYYKTYKYFEDFSKFSRTRDSSCCLKILSSTEKLLSRVFQSALEKKMKQRFTKWNVGEHLKLIIYKNIHVRLKEICFSFINVYVKFRSKRRNYNLFRSHLKLKGSGFGSDI